MEIENKITGRIKPLHGVDCAPYSPMAGKSQNFIKKFFDYGKFPFCRLHDCCGFYGGAYFVDVPNIFRDFDADETKEENYDFYYSDEYISAIVSTGAKIVYRLGVTIEWGSKRYTSVPPKDFHKWARICAHIVKHYNQKWAEGFEFGIDYWEIWNEPENPPMWTGTKESFFDLYRVASKYLKAEFPDLKIGGYGSSGFYGAFRENATDFQKSFVPYFTDFLSMVKKQNCPLDFFSWHIYTDDTSEIVKSALFVRETLDKNGFNNTESHLNEWNYGAEGGGFDKMDTLYGAAFIASALIAMQSIPVDAAQYYCASYEARYNGLMNIRSLKYSPVMHVMNAFAKLYENGNELFVRKKEDDPFVLASADGKTVRSLISCYRCEKKEFVLKASDDCEVYRLKESGFEAITFRNENGSICLPCHSDEVYYVTRKIG